MSIRALQVPASHVQPEINVTPLIDVMLVLLMIFMLTAQLTTHRIPLPLGGSDSPATPAMIALAIESTGELRLQGTPLSRAQLAAVLAADAKSANPPVLTIRPAADVSSDRVADVLALAQANGTTAIRVEGTRSE